MSNRFNFLPVALILWMLFVSMMTGIFQPWCWVVPVREGQVWVDCRRPRPDGTVNCDSIRVVYVGVNDVYTLVRPWYYDAEIPMRHNKFMFFCMYRRVK